MTQRALALDTRLARTHILRFVLVAMLFAMLVLVETSNAAVGAPGLRLYRFIYSTNLMAIVFAAAGMFSSAITEEREEQTLGLLRMANVPSLSILTGKWFPRLLACIALLSVQLPFTFLAVTLGGVTVHQILHGTLSMFAFLMLVAGVGLKMSVTNRTTGIAAWRTLGLLILFFMLIPMVLTAATATLSLVNAPALIADVVLNVHIFYDRLNPFAKAFEIAATTTSATNWLDLQIVSNIVGGGIFFLIAWFQFEHLEEEEKPPAPERRHFRITRKDDRFIGYGRALRPVLAWKDFQVVTGGWIMMLVKVFTIPAILLLSTLLAFISGQRMDSETVGMSLLTLGSLMLLCETCLYAANVFSHELKLGTFDAIMLLPTSTAWIGYSKVLGCLFGILPALCYFILGALLEPQYFQATFGELTWVLAITLIHLIVWISLHVKWGAIPLAMLILTPVYYVLEMFFTTRMFRWGGTEEFTAWRFLWVFAIVLLSIHLLIGRRLRVLAAQ